MSTGGHWALASRLVVFLGRLNHSSFIHSSIIIPLFSHVHCPFHIHPTFQFCAHFQRRFGNLQTQNQDRLSHSFTPFQPRILRFSRGHPQRPSGTNPGIRSIREWRRWAHKMGHSDRECHVCVFRHHRPGCWASKYHRTFLSRFFCSNVDFQAFPPANAIFAGIGILLLVGVLYLSFATCLTPCRSYNRRLGTRAPAESSLSTSLTASNVFFAGLRYTLAFHRLQQ